MTWDVLKDIKNRWKNGDRQGLGLRPLAVGRFIFQWLQEEDRARLKGAMRRADGRDESDDLYSSLADAEIGVPQAQGAKVTDEHAALFLEYLAIARVSPSMEWDKWRMLTRLCVGDDRAAHMSWGYGMATGFDDVFLYSENNPRTDFRAMLRAQREALIASGLDLPVAYARPALHRYPPDAQELVEPRQMGLFKDGEEG